MGILVFSSVYSIHYRFRCFGIRIFKIDLKTYFFKLLLKKIDPKHDDIYIIRHNIGESCIYLSYLNAWVKKMKSKNPLVIIWRKRDIAFYNLFKNSNIPFIYIPMAQEELDNFFIDDISYVGNFRFFVPTRNIAEKLYESCLSNANTHFYSFILDNIGLSVQDDSRQPDLPRKTIEYVDNFITSTLGNHPFILLCPEATSLKHLPNNFWLFLINTLEHDGFKVVVNSVSEDIFFKNCLTLSFSIDKVLALSFKAKAIVGLGSGLIVLLSMFNPKMRIIYTDLRNDKLSAEQILKFYTIKKLPWVINNQVNEFLVENTFFFDQYKLIEEITH